MQPGHRCQKQLWAISVSSPALAASCCGSALALHRPPPPHALRRAPPHRPPSPCPRACRRSSKTRPGTPPLSRLPRCLDQRRAACRCAVRKLSAARGARRAARPGLTTWGVSSYPRARSSSPRARLPSGVASLLQTTKVAASLMRPGRLKTGRQQASQQAALHCWRPSTSRGVVPGGMPLQATQLDTLSGGSRRTDYR